MTHLEHLVQEYTPSALFMAATGMLDSAQTYLNIVSNNSDIYLEGNPLIQKLMESTDLETGLFLPKIAALALASVFPMLQKMDLTTKREKFVRDKGKYFVYGIGMYWTFGFLSNYLLH